MPYEARQEAAVQRSTTKRHQTLAEELVRLRADAGISQAQLAGAARVDRRFLARIEGGGERPSLETYQRLATALGADLRAHLYPNTGSSIRDGIQARILEFELQEIHPRWDRFTEVRVDRPDRGWIDLALHTGAERLMLANEIQSELRRLEQLIRWSAAKAASLPSWEGWATLGPPPAISRVLVVRRTRATTTVAREFARQLRAAYPAHPDDALAALTGTSPWPGPAMIWVTLDGARTRFASGR